MILLLTRKADHGRHGHKYWYTSFQFSFIQERSISLKTIKRILSHDIYRTYYREKTQWLYCWWGKFRFSMFKRSLIHVWEHTNLPSLVWLLKATHRLMNLTFTPGIDRSENDIDNIILVVMDKAPKLLDGLSSGNQRNLERHLTTRCYSQHEVLFR